MVSPLRPLKMDFYQSILKLNDLAIDKKKQPVIVLKKI